MFSKRDGPNNLIIFLQLKLFTSSVRPVLEHASIIWDPYISSQISRNESVQKQFLPFALRHRFISKDFPKLFSYSVRLSIVDLPSLQFRRFMMDSLFISNLLKCDVVARDILKLFGLGLLRLSEPHL